MASAMSLELSGGHILMIVSVDDDEWAFTAGGRVAMTFLLTRTMGSSSELCGVAGVLWAMMSTVGPGGNTRGWLSSMLSELFGAVGAIACLGITRGGDI